MNIRAFVGFLLFLSLAFSSNAQQAESIIKANSNQQVGFIENKGQIIDLNNSPTPAVLYLLNTPGMNVQLKRCGFSYDVYSVGSQQSAVNSLDQSSSILHPPSSILQPPSSIFHYHRIDIDLEGIKADYKIET